MEIKALDYKGDAKIVEIPDTWDYIHVTVVSGDEIIRIAGVDEWIDASIISRTWDFYDGEYEVAREEFDEWNQRKDSYAWFERDIERAFAGLND